ncbi:unnamed protein product [Peronospora belbahrii]|uniref:WRKY19-like zinc finger domain-containing protein n=1 Tax=Peronospora belbahrii TaxID=622444 RepID=A0AAU9KUW7_9STRA|nr:unnamed protein product [Peronospora belbahrii]CAH0515036.1 unnamed protein product [Peronospora belbahrii]
MVVLDASSFPIQGLPDTPFSTFTVNITPSLSSYHLSSIAIMNQEETTKDSSTSANQGSEYKSALSFILSSFDSESEEDEFKARTRDSISEPTRAKCRRSVKSASMSPMATTAVLAFKPASKKGSKFCSIEGCMSRAKHAKRCWKHGGWVRCKMPGCNNRAKSKGVCWSHGGGTVCSFESCDTIAVSNGFCWAHGGGKRCQVPNCSKPAYERTQNYCQAHYEEIDASTDFKMNDM